MKELSDGFVFFRTGFSIRGTWK